MPVDLRSGRNVRPTDRDSLWNWIYLYTGVKVARRRVCEGHSSPLDAISAWQARPPHALLCGPRGGGKSFLSSIDTHLDSRHLRGHATRILGGSKAQSQQVHQGLKEAVLDGRGPDGGNDFDQIEHMGVVRTDYKNGSTVEILTASPLSVRGPHVPCLKIDEVDEVDPAIREDAHGMVMDKGRYVPKIIQTSTHHRLGGPMGDLLKRAAEIEAERPGTYPVHTFCTWEVLQPCPEEVSGAWVGGQDAYERCPECPLMKYCHEDRDKFQGVPKAKRGSRYGHYTVPSLIQKLHGVSTRIFEADYLCMGPKADGIWFTEFDEHPGMNCREVPHDRNYMLRVAADAGTSFHTGAVVYQAWEDRATGRPCVNILADYYAQGLHSQQNAEGVMRAVREIGLNPDSVGSIALDPAASAQTGIGPAALAEWRRVWGGGDERVHLAPRRPVVAGLDFLEMMVRLADGTRTLWVHPRCRHVLDAFRGYRRRKRNGQWVGEPEDPQHPHEELIDAVRYGAWDAFPSGYPQALNLDAVHVSRIF